MNDIWKIIEIKEEQIVLDCEGEIEIITMSDVDKVSLSPLEIKTSEYDYLVDYNGYEKDFEKWLKQGGYL